MAIKGLALKAPNSGTIRSAGEDSALGGNPAPKNEQKVQRNEAIDVLKGIGITFVLLNHSFARGSRKFLGTSVTEDPILYAINRAIHFAVPVFLFISCALLARSLAKRFDVGKYAKSRARKTLVPYLVASLLYFLWSNGNPFTSAWDLQRLGVNLVTGKASFHLYFTVVLLQAGVAIPFLISLSNGRKWSIPVAFGAGIAAQLAIYSAQRAWFGWQNPGSVLLWYILPLVLGIAVGMDTESTEKLKKRLPLLGIATLVGLVVYVWVSVGKFYGHPGTSDQINGSYAVFTATLSLFLWTVSSEWPKGVARSYFNAIGRVSLPVFLVHPFVMSLAGGPRLTNVFLAVPGGWLLYFLTIVAVSYGFAIVFSKLGVGRWVLGQGPLFAKWKPAVAKAG
jgi:surface polysaccharide O-acyltransferase-like enzyme